MNEDFLERINKVESILTPQIIRPDLKLGSNNCIGCHHINKLSIYTYKGILRAKCWRPSCYLNKSVSLIQLKAYMENANYTTALGSLEKELGINNKDKDKDKDKESSYIIERSNILNKCLEVYEYYLWKDACGQQALDYLYSRGFNSEIIKNKRIGFAPHKYCLSWFDLNKEDLNKQGLMNSFNIEYFINRIIFPIFDVNNNLIHFTGRHLGEIKKDLDNNPIYPRYKDSKSIPKIPNTKDFLVFENSLVDYISLDDYDSNSTLYVCEGFPDALTLAQYGFNVIGLLGIEKLNKHYSKLRYFRNLVFLFDNDTHYDYLLNKEISKSYSRIIPQLVELQTKLPETNFKVYSIPKLEGVKDINDLFIKGIKEGKVEEVIESIKTETIDFMDFYIESEGVNLNNHLNIIKIISLSKNKERGMNKLKKFVQYTDPLKYVTAILS